MKKNYFFNLAFSEFHVHRKRFNLTALGIAWGTCSILVLLAFGQGLKDRLGSVIERVGDNIIMVRGRRTTRSFRGLPKRRWIGFNSEDVSLLKNSIPELKYAGGTYRNWGQKAIAGKKEAEIEITGVDMGYSKVRYLIPLKGGRTINKEDVFNKRRVIVMGQEAAEQFFDLNNAIGQVLLINNVPFTVVGVLQKKEMAVTFGSNEAMKTYIPDTTFAALHGNTYFDRIFISLKDSDDAEYVKSRVRKLLASKHKFHPEDEAAVSFRDTMEMTDKLKNVMMGFQVLLGFIGGITLLISGVGLANIMYASIKRRTKEIGIKIAIGAEPAQIRKQIVAESFFFSIAGGCMGGIMAFIIVALFTGMTISNKALQFFMNARLSFGVWIATSIVLVIITFFAGYFPARAASKQNPINSLRYE